MSLLVPWLAFPLVLLVLCAGAGLLVERASGTRLPGPLLLPLGFAALVSLTQLTTYREATAPATVPLVLVVAAAGLILARTRLRELRPDPWAAGLALVTYCVFAAPAALWGSRTFLGYGNLGDAAIHFEIVDLLLERGHSIAGLPPSSFAFSADTYFQTAYPTGGHSVLAAVQALVATDVAWLFQPFLTVLAVLIALGLHPLARELTDDRRLAAVAAGVAAQAGLVYGYAVHQEAIKELGAIAMLVLLVALVPPLLRATPTWRAAIPLAVATGGGLGVLSLALAPWLGPILLVAAAILAVRHARTRPRALALEIAVFAALAAVLAIPRIVQLGAFVRVNSSVLTAQQEFGNLQGPLDFIQAFGVWPVTDFRFGQPPTNGLAIALVGVAVLAAVLGLIAVVRRRAWGVALFVGVSLLAFLVVSRSASPWAYGKTLMLLSPALVLLAAAGAVGLRRLEGTVVLGALAAGVLWTNALAYHAVDAAPAGRHGELAQIGERFAGQGPSVYVEFDEFAKHYLHQTDPTGVAETFRPPWPVLEEGAAVRFGFSSDIGDWTPQSLAEHFKLIVLRQGPAQSRPPAGWRRVFHGDHYDVWQREADAPQVLAQLRLGNRLDAGAVPPCADVRRLAGTARAAGGRLAYVERPRTVVFHPTRFGAPANWGVDPSDPEVFRQVGPGRVHGDVFTSHGRHSIWFEASAVRAARVRVDGEVVGVVEDHLNPRQSSVRLATLELDGGRHTITVEVGGGDVEPGNGGFNRLVGPVFLTPDPDPNDNPVRTLAPDRWRDLCGRRLDWIQVLA